MEYTGRLWGIISPGLGTTPYPINKSLKEEPEKSNCFQVTVFQYKDKEDS